MAGRCWSPGSRGPRRAGANAVGRRIPVRLLGPALLLLGATSPARAASNNVRISSLADVAFGLLTNLSADAVSSQSVCVYANTATNGYNVRASGSGPGGAFSLASAGGSLPFAVEWNGSSGQSSGAQLTPNVALSGEVSSATQQTCNSGPATSASLIVILRAAALSSATAGSYNGSLTLVIGPE
ncbi:MAG: hypothetical protein ACTHJK_14410 [Sphingomicrobium sp.]